jgi:hypothetical protein
MTERSRTVLIALGVSLLVVALAPLLVCLGGMAGMGRSAMMSGSGEMMMSGSGEMMMSGGPMITGGIVLLLIVIAGVVSPTLGLRRG